MISPNYRFVVVTLKNGDKRRFESDPEHVYGLSVWEAGGRLVVRDGRYEEEASRFREEGIDWDEVASFSPGDWASYELLET